MIFTWNGSAYDVDGSSRSERKCHRMRYKESAGVIAKGESSIQDKSSIVFLHICDFTHFSCFMTDKFSC